MKNKPTHPFFPSIRLNTLVFGGLLTIFFLFSTTPTHAFDLLDFLFPPVQMQPAKRDTPKESLAPEIPSNDTYSNTLDNNTIKCEGNVGLSKTWDPEKKTVTVIGEDGKPYEQEEFVPYDAKNLEGEMDVKNLSNDYYRNFQAFFARGGVKCTEKRAQRNFNSLGMDGSSASQRATPYAQVLYSRGQFLSEVALSLFEGDPPYDTVVQDYQIAWSCSGTCQELTNQAIKNCRPVFASELIYGLQSEKVYYSSPSADPTTFPSNVIGAVNSHYGGSCGQYGCYKNRSGGKPFSPLSKDLYKLMFKQVNFVPKGNVDNKVIVVRYDDYDMAAQKKLNPSPTVFHRTLPNAAAANGKEAQKSLSYVNPSQQENLPNANLCDNVKVTSDVARDKPVVGLISIFVHGLFKHVPAGESHSQSETNEITSKYDNQVVPNTQTAEQAFANMIPDSVLKKQDYINQEFSSKTTANKDYPIPDPGYRANLLYREMLSLLRPSSWF